MSDINENLATKSQQLTMTAEAIKAALNLQASHPEWQGLPLRLYLDGKGCDGFFYGVSFDKAEVTDLHFEQTLDGAVVDLITDQDTIEFVNHATIRWDQHEGQEGFLVENPRHKHFRGKFYKRSFWKKKLVAKTDR